MKAACNNFGRQTYKQVVVFPDPNRECVGNKDKGGYINGRIEQTERVNFPEGAVICDTNIKSLSKEIRFDDEIFSDSKLLLTYILEI